MGNKSSHKRLLAKTKLEDYDNIPDIYKIVSPKGDGELVLMAKIAHRRKDYTKMDEYIRTEVSKYLLNNGQGAKVPVDEILRYRFLDIECEDCKTAPIKTDKIGTKKEFKSVYVCSDLSKRGKNGETLLQLCLMNGTFIHRLIAKRLLTIFPNMTKDFCIGDEHYGETALHMAIVNEDPYMVQYLLMHGADVDHRACGRFFLPDDQKENRQDMLVNEYPVLSVETNYHGFCYFGEYPLCFAAILNQPECVRLLIAHGADPNKQDSNGNTVLHMLVINNNIEMFKLLVEHKVNLNIKNNQGFTPLTLAAELGHKEIFTFILETIREVYWIYADVSCAAYPLTNVDTISEDGTIDTKSALYLILNKNSEEHLELLEGYLTDLLHKKWITFVRFRFYLEFFIFGLFFILNAVTLFLKRIYYDHLSAINCTIMTNESNYLSPECECAYLNSEDDQKYPRTIIEIIVVLYTIVYILITINELYIQRWRFLKNLISNPTKIIFLLALAAIIIIIPMRFACFTEGEDILVVLIIIFLGIYSLYFARGFKLVCTFVYNFHVIIGTNVSRFFLIYGIFLMGFSQPFYLIFHYYTPEANKGAFGTPFQAILDTFVLTLGEVIVDFEEFEFFSSYMLIGSIYTVIYMILGTSLLVNILIAMMDHTQEITNDRPNEWIRQWGLQVLAVEQNTNTKERLKQQKRYIHLMNNGVKALIVRWIQKDAERIEAKKDNDIFQENIKQVPAAHKH